MHDRGSFFWWGVYEMGALLSTDIARLTRHVSGRRRRHDVSDLAAAALVRLWLRFESSNLRGGFASVARTAARHGMQVCLCVCVAQQAVSCRIHLCGPHPPLPNWLVICRSPGYPSWWWLMPNPVGLPIMDWLQQPTRGTDDPLSRCHAAARHTAGWGRRCVGIEERECTADENR